MDKVVQPIRDGAWFGGYKATFGLLMHKQRRLAGMRLLRRGTLQMQRVSKAGIFQRISSWRRMKG